MPRTPDIQEATLTVFELRLVVADKNVRLSGEQARLVNRLTREDLNAVGEAIEHLHSAMPVKITRADGMIVLAWHPNGSTGAVIEHGRVIRGE